MKMNRIEGIRWLACLQKIKRTLYSAHACCCHFLVCFLCYKSSQLGKSSFLESSQTWTRQQELLACIHFQGPKLIASYSEHFCKFCRNVHIPYNFRCVVDRGVLVWCCPARTADVVWLTAVNPALSPEWTADKVWFSAENPTLSCHSS